MRLISLIVREIERVHVVRRVSCATQSTNQRCQRTEDWRYTTAQERQLHVISIETDRIHCPEFTTAVYHEV